MQKVLQRTAMAKKQAQRKVDLFSKKVAKAELKEFRKEVFAMKKYQNGYKKEARIARREDWELGPLAPRRDVGDKAESYGSVTVNTIMCPDMPPSLLKQQKKHHMKIGDRVVILKGLDKGKIGIIREFKEDANAAFIEGLRLVDVHIPLWQRKATNDPNAIRAMEAPILLSDVRLVHALPDPSTGRVRDVIVDKFTVKKLSPDGPSLRYIDGTNEVIPWPAKTEPPSPENDDDTVAAVRDEVTWIPELLTQPLPAGVINELRNPYSRFRTRHTPEFIAAKKAEDERVAVLNDPEKNHMKSALQELHTYRRKEKEAKGQPTLSRDMLAAIGETMSLHKEKLGAKIART